MGTTAPEIGHNVLQRWPRSLLMMLVREKRWFWIASSMTAGWDETEEVLMDVSSRRLAPVKHRHLPARGLLSLPSLLSAFLLTAIKRTQARERDRITTKHTYYEKTWPTSDRPHDTELLRQYHRITHIICQRSQSNPDEGGRRTAKRILSGGYSGVCHNSSTHHNMHIQTNFPSRPSRQKRDS